MENIEELKKQYEEEIYRLTSLTNATQQQYQQAYNDLKQQEKDLLEEYQQKISDLSIGIERLRGAYTALTDLGDGKDPSLVVNGMMKPEDTINENTEIDEDKEQEDVKQESTENKEKTKKEDKTDKDVNSMSKVAEKAKEAVKKAKEKDLITPYEEFANSELGKETAVKNVTDVVSKEAVAKLHQSGEAILSDEELKALESIVPKKQQEDTKEPDSKAQSNSRVDPKDVPDYLKEQYGMEN